MKPTLSNYLIIGLVGLAACKASSGGSSSSGDNPESATKAVEAGAECREEGERVCKGKKQLLVCDDGAWEAYPCEGEGGCKGTGAALTCDISGNEDGAACEDKTAFVCDGKREVVTCKKGKVTRSPCRGALGCRTEGERTKCDVSISQIATPCGDDLEGVTACSIDQTAELICKNGEWTQDRNCRGPRGCWIDGDNLGCDQSVALLGDPCTPDGAAACAEGASALLKCGNGRWVFSKNCSRRCYTDKKDQVWCR